MEEKISSPYLSHYNGGVHISFHRKMVQICDKNETVIEAAELLAKYKAQVELEETIYK
jgi:hypothetical protein